MEGKVFTKIDNNHAVNSDGFEVTWGSRHEITYSEPPREMAFYVEGYRPPGEEWHFEIIQDDRPLWRPPYENESIPTEQIKKIQSNLMAALQFLYPIVLFRIRKEGK